VKSRGKNKTRRGGVNTNQRLPLSAKIRIARLAPKKRGKNFCALSNHELVDKNQWGFLRTNSEAWRTHREGKEKKGKRKKI